MPSSSQKDSLARAIGSTLWKGYDDLMSTMIQTKKKTQDIAVNQIPPSLDKWEDGIIKAKKLSE